MKFRDNFGNRPHAKPEVNSGEVLVDISSYVSANKRIKALEAAGQRLIAARQEQYEFEEAEGIPHDYFDITTYRGADITDVYTAANRLDERIAAKKKDREAIASIKEGGNIIPTSPTKLKEGPSLND